MSRLHPNDWAECRLGDITFESSIRLKDTDYVGLPVYGVDNVVGLNPTPRYTADNFERYKVVEHGMFAYNPMRLNIGSIGYSFNYHPTCLVSPDYVVFGCRAEYLFSDFLYHHIKSQRWVDQTKNSGSGSVRFRIYYETLADFRIVLPPLTEQRKIAAILSTWDEAIALTEQLTAALGRRKQALMQLLLTGDVRFAEFEGSEWETKELQELVLPKEGIRRGPFGGALKKEIFVETGYKVYEQKNVINNDLDLGSYFIDRDKFNELKSFSVQEKDLLISCSGTIGRIIAIPPDAPLGVINQALLRLRLNEELVDQKFFIQQFRSRITQKLIIENTQGGAMQNLVGMEVFRQVPFDVPSLLEQMHIASTLQTEDRLIDLFSQYQIQLQEQKRGLMQQLLMGQVRV